MKSVFTEKLLSVRHTRCRHGKPLCVIENLPGEGCEATPAQMRALAQVLIQAAKDADRRKTNLAETLLYPMQGGAA